MSSWIGTGRNLPVSADQVQQVLGAEQIRTFAQKTGITTEAAGQQLAGSAQVYTCFRSEVREGDSG